MTGRGGTATAHTAPVTAWKPLATRVAPGPVEQTQVGSIDELHHVLGSATTRGASRGDLARADLDDAVHAAVEFAADPGAGLDARVVAQQIGQAVAGRDRLELPAAAQYPVDWSGFGTVIPVLAGSAGAGASVLAAVLVDALQQHPGLRVLLVDAADPAR